MRGQPTCSDRGQATVELALVLPVLVLFLLALVQTALVARDAVLVQDAARAAVREASVDAGAVGCVTRRGARSVASRSRCTGPAASAIRWRCACRYREHTDLPLVGPLFPDVTLTGEGDDAGRAVTRRATIGERGVRQHAGARRRRALGRAVPAARAGRRRRGAAARADTAADAAALAGADALALGTWTELGAPLRHGRPRR